MGQLCPPARRDPHCILPYTKQGPALHPTQLHGLVLAQGMLCHWHGWKTGPGKKCPIVGMDGPSGTPGTGTKAQPFYGGNIPINPHYKIQVGVLFNVME